MLKKEFRLASFSLSNPKQVSAKYFRLKYSANKEDTKRFAFVVSKKTEKRSSSRNEMKRKVRSAIEIQLENITSGYDFIFYPKRETLSITSKEISGELAKVLEKENLINV